MYEKYSVVLAVAGFIFNSKNELLIVKKSKREQVDADLWTVPGGKIYPQEPIIVGLKRELCEEVGIEVDCIEWIGEDVFREHTYMFHAQHFRCKTGMSGPPIKLEAKLEESKWIKGLHDIEGLPFADNIKKRITELFSKT